jgi:catechol 2,3-dioxygenase-like lactoylglutathione lyase family enzyme
VSEWDKEIGAMTLLVADLDRSRKFYENAFGLSAQFEDETSVAFRFAAMFVFLHKSWSAAPAGEPPAEVKELALTGAGQFAIIVEDVDAVSADLKGREVALLSGPADRAWGMRTLTFADPSGYVWEIAQEISA